MSRIPSDELLELVVANGYARAAATLGVSTSHLWNLTDKAGLRPQVAQRRGRSWGKFTQREAAAVLGVSCHMVSNMLKDGRLSSPLNRIEVEQLRKSWSLVPHALTADEASRWDSRWRRCLFCLKYFRLSRTRVKDGAGKTCSRECMSKWRLFLNPRINVTKVRVAKPPAKRRFYAGYCAGCGEPFVRERIVKYCSPDCGKRARRDVRKARERGAVKTERVFRSKVYERDKWRCHICNGKIDQALRAPDPGAATLDHIHPLSLGGSHTYDNVKAAHYGCNSARGNRDEFQMRMSVAA